MAMFEINQDSYVRCASSANSEDINLIPTHNGCIAQDSLNCLFPGAVGMKFRSEEVQGAWVAIRKDGDRFQPPANGWGNITYVVVYGMQMQNKLAQAEQTSTMTGQRGPLGIVGLFFIMFIWYLLKFTLLRPGQIQNKNCRC